MQPTDVTAVRPPASTAKPGTVHVEHCMGTVFTIDIRDPGRWDDAVADAVAWLHHVDAVFSPYRADSAISRLDRGEITTAQCPPEVQRVLRSCAEVAVLSEGYFSVRPAGRLDPSGLVKGWAIEHASRLLTARGAANHAVNGGGDMQLAGEAAPGRAWRVGIAHPLRRGTLAAVVTGRDIAVATSGTGERGAHIVDPVAGRPATELAAVTIVGTRLTTVDAYATAAFARGDRAQAWVRQLPRHEGMTIDGQGRMWRTPGFPAG